MTGLDRDPAEAALPRTLHGRAGELRDLFARSSDHWGFEDPIYRFYHQSYKVYSLQDQTESIVRALADLLPTQC